MAKYQGYERNAALLFWLTSVTYFGFSLRDNYQALRPQVPMQHAVQQALYTTWNSNMKWYFLTWIALFLGIFFYVLYQQRSGLFWQRLYPEPSARFAQKQSIPTSDPLILKHWVNVVKRANTGTPENIRLAILEGDALVDTFLKRRGYDGDTMADRLKHFSSDSVKSLDNLWSAHKLRNKIAHTPGFSVSSKEAEIALMAFRSFLKELGAF